MYIHTSSRATILFGTWTTESNWDIALAAAGVFLLAVTCEVLKFYEVAIKSSHRRHDYHAVSDSNLFQGRTFICRGFLSSSHFLATLVHFLQVSTSFLLMLIAMTFNLWLLMATVAGLTFGFFVLNWKSPPTVTCN